MGRRTSLAALAGDEVEDVPGTSELTLLHVPLNKLVPTRFNPRRNFGTNEQLLEFGLVLKKRQLQPAVVVSRSAYLELWPDEAEHVGDATYVIANGERRYRGSKEAGLERLWVVHREEVASSKADFLDAVLSENNDRDDLDPIERALGMETMVQELGGVGEVAKHYGKSAGWVSQQRRMLKLVPELQALVSSEEMPQREGYRIAGLPAGEQVQEWKAELARRKEEGERRKAEAEARKAARPLPKPRKEKKAAQQKPAEDTGAPAGFSVLDEEASPNAGAGDQPEGETPAGSGFSALNADDGEQAENAEEQGRDRPTAEPTEEGASKVSAESASAVINGASTSAGNPTSAASAEADTPETGKAGQPRQLPYDEPFYVVQHLHVKMTGEHFAQGGRMWMTILREQHPEAFHALLQELTEQDEIEPV